MQPVFIVDTNVVVAALITSQVESPTARLLDAMVNGRLIYLLSPALLGEYRAVMLRPRLIRAHGLAEAEIDTLLTELTGNAIWREPPADAEHQAPDPNDAHLWALLACEPAAVLITGDLLLLDNPRPGRSLISPATWAGDLVD